MPLFEDDEDDYDRRPRRRPRRDDYYDERDDYDDLPSYHAAPEDRVRGPGVALFIVGLIFLFLSLVGTGLFAVWAMTDDFGPQQRDDEILFVVLGVGAVISIFYFGIIAVGGWQMWKLRSYGWSFTSAIMCIGTILCLGIWGIVIIPFGIWALVVLCDPRVKQAFRGPLRPRRAADDGYDDY